MTSSFYLNNKKILKDLAQDNGILIKEASFKEYKEVINDYQEEENRSLFCFNEMGDKEFLSMCSSSHTSTIGKVDTIKNNYLLNIKKKIQAGKILKIELNQELLNDYEMINKYLSSKGLSLSTINQTLKEC